MTFWLLSPNGIRGTLTVDNVEISAVSEFKLIETVSNMYYNYFLQDYSKCPLPNRINIATCILEGSWVVAKYLHFPLLMTGWLCHWHCLWWFLWFTGAGSWFYPSTWVHLVSLCIPLFGVQVLHLPMAVHIHIYICWLSCLISFWAPHWVPKWCHASFSTVTLFNLTHFDFTFDS